jgi:hypothetical protein
MLEHCICSTVREELMTSSFAFIASEATLTQTDGK